MKLIILAVVLLLSGCAAAKSMQQLEKEALKSGDWSKVEQRGRITVGKRRHRNSLRLNCLAGQIAVCEQFGSKDKCTCHARRRALGVIYGRQ